MSIGVDPTQSVSLAVPEIEGASVSSPGDRIPRCIEPHARGTRSWLSSGLVVARVACQGMRRQAVFLDRDGVLNHVDENGWGPRGLSDLRVVDGAADAVDRLRQRHFITIVVTNQPDVARGKLTLESALAINERIRHETGVDAVYTCSHDEPDGCACRKPRPGMLFQAAEDLTIDLSRSWLIGDRWVDIEAGEAAGVRTILLEAPYSWRSTGAGSPPAGLTPDCRAHSLGACVDLILSGSGLPTEKEHRST